jgi:hypothetical protein
VAKTIKEKNMNWDIFKGFWLGVISLLFVEASLIWTIDEAKAPNNDDHNHIQPA